MQHFLYEYLLQSTIAQLAVMAAPLFFSGRQAVENLREAGGGRRHFCVYSPKTRLLSL
jgi:hypothetical protein